MDLAIRTWYVTCYVLIGRHLLPYVFALEAKATPSAGFHPRRGFDIVFCFFPGDERVDFWLYSDQPHGGVQFRFAGRAVVCNRGIGASPGRAVGLCALAEYQFRHNTGDDLGFLPGSSYTTNIIDTLDVPTTGAPIYVTNYVTITYILTNLYPNLPALRQIRSDVVWTYPLTGQLCTNTAITLRAPDQ